MHKLMINRYGYKSKSICRLVLLCACSLLLSSTANAADYLTIPGGQITSVLSGPNAKDKEDVRPFSLRTSPVTNGEYQQFLQMHPEWQRARVPAIFADASYLHTWASPTYTTHTGDTDKSAQAVTSVSWYAAQAYCESENARLPSWLEWELVAAADAHHADARSDPDWRARILSWYSVSSNDSSNLISHIPNYYGIKDMHGLIWEWVSDFNALLISPDSRTQGDPDKLQFCGAGATSLQNKENYAILMRVALLSSLTGASTTDNLGFRCARDLTEERK